jgi:hypothetical protein
LTGRARWYDPDVEKGNPRFHPVSFGHFVIFSATDIVDRADKPGCYQGNLCASPYRGALEA